jgi:hypothetical protein
MNTFNNKFINNWKTLQTSRIGFEFEFMSNHTYVKMLELLNNEFSPIEVWGFNQYHSKFEPTEKKFKIEPDYSGGSEMIELVTGPMNWVDARLILLKMLNFIKKHGYTDDHCSVHINISFTDLDVKNMDPVKLILNLNEDFIYEIFPNRRNNIYAQSVKWIVPFEDWEDSVVAANSIVNSMQIPDDTKYYGVNLQKKWKGWLEYRYIGGKDYHLKPDEIMHLMDYFILQTRQAITDKLNEEDNVILLSYLEDNINWFMQYKTYNDFLVNIEGITIEVDKSSDYELVSSSWEKFYKKLFEIIKSCGSIKNATLNYNTTNNRFEIIGAIVKDVYYLKNVDFIECNLTEVTIYNCDIIESEVTTGHVYNCDIYESKINTCKINESKVLEWSKLYNCLFNGGTMNGYMEGGVFRSGHIGEDAEIHMNVKMANKSTFWNVYNPVDKKVSTYQDKK